MGHGLALIDTDFLKSVFIWVRCSGHFRLTIAELSVMLNRSYQVISDYAREWREETGETLPLKGLPSGL